MKWKPFEIRDPLFLPGSAHTAIARLPVSPAGLNCTIELFLSLDGGQTKVTTSGPQTFTSGEEKVDVSLAVPIPTPAVGASYGVYIVVASGGAVIAGFQAKESVIVPVVGTPDITWG